MLDVYIHVTPLLTEGGTQAKIAVVCMTRNMSGTANMTGLHVLSLGTWQLIHKWQCWAISARCLTGDDECRIWYTVRACKFVGSAHKRNELFDQPCWLIKEPNYPNQPVPS